MPADDILLDAEERMEKAVDSLGHSLRTVRTGRASPALLDHIRVDYYGSPTPLRQLANIGAPEPQLIVIRPFDPGCIKDIERAVQQSDIGITPQNDGKFIRLVIPPLSEERRKQLASQVREMGEETKVAIRNIRRDANKTADQEKRDGVLAEDEAFRTRDEIQSLTRDYEGKVDEVVKAKSDEVMTF